MNEEHITEIMRLAGLLATARVLRYRAKNGDTLAVAQTEVRVIKATAQLRSYLERLGGV